MEQLLPLSIGSGLTKPLRMGNEALPTDEEKVTIRFLHAALQLVLDIPIGRPDNLSRDSKIPLKLGLLAGFDIECGEFQDHASTQQ